MKKTIFSFFLILLLFLTACNAGSTEPDVQQEAQPQRRGSVRKHLCERIGVV